MAETAQMNGPTEGSGKYIDSIDPDDPEYQRQMRRPVEIKEDLHQMNARKRVSLIVNSQAFRDELEEIVNSQLKQGTQFSNLVALQQIAELILPASKAPHGQLLAKQGAASAATPVIPINDARGMESTNFSKAERLLRCKVASLYRVVDMLGWSHGIYNHISARINQEHEHFLINPFGYLYSEVTASSLVKINLQGEVVDAGSTTLGVNKAGFTIHAAIHAARPDIKCIVHVHLPSVVAVSMMKQGLLPISQESLICGEVSYYDYKGIVVDEAEMDVLARTLGPINKILVLRNHGAVACGATVEEAFHYTWNMVHACETQVRAAAVGLDNVYQVDEEVRKRAHEVGSRGGGGVNKKEDGLTWRSGELEFEALMRHLDNAGFKTGYMYKQPIIKQPGKLREQRTNSEVEVPPASTSFSVGFDEDGDPIRMLADGRKKAQKSEWLNSPNVYTKTEIDEIGTSDPKKITKWVQDPNSPGPKQSTPIKIDNKNQFAPLGDNPKEFKEAQKSIRKGYYEEKITAGPQSRILEGTTWEEAQRMGDADQSGAQDRVIVVGAASKGIIKRDQQHNAMVYKSTYASNPFDNMSADEIEAYKAEVERKAGGGTGTGDASQEPVAEAIDDEAHLKQTPVKVLPTPVKTTQPIAASTPKVRAPVLQTAVRPKSTSYETNIDDVLDGTLDLKAESSPHIHTAYMPNRSPTNDQRPRAQSYETNIDDVFDSEPSAASTPRRVAAPVLVSSRIPSTPNDNSYETNIDDVLDVASEPRAISTPRKTDLDHGTEGSFQRSSSARYPPPQSPALVEELKQKNFERSKSERMPKREEKPASPTKSDTMRSTDMSSAGDTLDERSSKEGSPTKEPSEPTKEKKKKKKLRLPSFSKKKKDKKEKEKQAAGSGQQPVQQQTTHSTV